MRSTSALSMAARAMLVGMHGSASSPLTGNTFFLRQERILFSGRHFKSANLREPTSGKSPWTGTRCLIWMTIASKESRCCRRSVYVEMALAAAAEAFPVTIICAERCGISPGAFPARRRDPHDSGDPLSGCGRNSIHSYLQLPARCGATQSDRGHCMRQEGFVLKQDWHRFPERRTGSARRDPGSMLGADLCTRLLSETS